jgi:hypothetical protein
VASDIAREAPWPLNVVVMQLMALAFPDPLEASLAVLNLADGKAAVGVGGGLGRGARAVGKGAAKEEEEEGEEEQQEEQVHWHMGEPRAAGMGAADPALGRWLWARTQALLARRAPPAV